MDSLNPPDDGAGDTESGEEGFDVSVEASGDAPIVLQSSEAALDHISGTIECLVIDVLDFAIGAWRNDRFCPSYCEPVA